MCVDAVESKYQTLNKCKLLFDLLVLQQQHLHCSYIVFGNIPIRLAKFERNFRKHNFYFVTQFMSKCNLYLETEGVHLRMCLPFRLETPTLLNGCFTPKIFSHLSSNIVTSQEMIIYYFYVNDSSKWTYHLPPAPEKSQYSNNQHINSLIFQTWTNTY
jgi:hypothetical protein